MQNGSITSRTSGGGFAIDLMPVTSLLFKLRSPSAALLSAAGNQLWHHFADPLELQFMWPRVVGATFVICGVWATHTLVEPFEYGFQNVAASWLYLAQLGLLWLGAVRDAGLERSSEFAAPRPPLTADRIPLPSGVRDAQG